MTKRFCDKNGLSVEPAVLDEGGGLFPYFIVRDQHGGTLSPTRGRGPVVRATKPEHLAALGVDLDSLREVADVRQP